MENLLLIKSKLQEIKQKYRRFHFHYSIPGLWNDSVGEIRVNPFDFFINRIELIENNQFIDNSDVCYNLFIRYACSWDHNFETNAKKYNLPDWNENGSFLKAIALLPYLKSLGINKIHLLPITSIGDDEKKGNLGSPYAIKNHYKLDNSLSEDILGLEIETQYKAFIEACHHLKIKVIQEFIFRTASVDADIALENPEWFYWIKAKTKIKTDSDSSGYSAPQFSERRLKQIKDKIDKKDFNDLTTPDPQFLNYFTNTPKSQARVDGKIIGLLSNEKKQKSNEVKIAPAFADWPPDDNQPAWTDVTYFKLFDKKEFNYIAYNTIRMYDDNLAKEDNIQTSLWGYISDILPFWINKFNIDGAMIDMGHALPKALLQSIIQKAKKVKNDFIFWEENFAITKDSKNTGYDTALGYLIFEFNNASKYRELIHNINQGNYPIDILLTPENHNTNRTINYSNNKDFLITHYLLNQFIKGQKYIHNGFELLENKPTNTGLGFSESEQDKFSDLDLPLFNKSILNWSGDNILDEIKEINKIVKQIDVNSVEIIDTDIDDIIYLKINSEYYLLSNFSNNNIEFSLNSKNILFGNSNYQENTINAFSSILFS